MFYSQAIDTKKIKTEGVLDADDLAFLESGTTSPALSDTSHVSKGAGEGGDDSSNEALVVDCESPRGSNTPGMYSIYDYQEIYEEVRSSKKLSIFIFSLF
jgi:hypothetical protein